MLVLKIGLTGFAILLAAILLNILANAIGLATWYDFLGSLSRQGLMGSLRSLKALDYIFLIVLYPVMLGLAAYLAFYLTGLARP
jgi:hypothetical protein